jgi:hypothetical protein
MMSRSDGRRLTVFFASYAPDSAVCHYRMAMPARALQALGHDTHLGSSAMQLPTGEVVGVANAAVEEGRPPDRPSLVTDIDVLVLQPRIGFDLTGLIDSARRSGQVVVVDLDDWWWDVPVQRPHRPGFEEVVRDWLPVLERMLSTCDGVTVSSQYIAAQLLRWPDRIRVAVVRDAIDPERWGTPEVVTDGPVLGYAGALSFHWGDVATLSGWLGGLIERHDMQIVHVGGHPELPDFAETAHIDPDRVEVRPGVAWADYAGSRPFAGIDIGIVPLEARPFSEAKSSLKGMEFAACGIPIVASPSFEYRRLGFGKVAGRSLDDQPVGEWIEAVESLLDSDERTRVASYQTSALTADHADARAHEWERFYLELIGDRGAPPER